MLKSYLGIILIAVLLLGSSTLSAQDGHYWSQRYGTTSTLLGGVVIGSVKDLGAVFYNPGQLAMSADPSFLLSAKVYQLEKITAKDALGNNRDLKQTNFGGAPDLLAGSFDFKSLPNHRFGYSFLTRRRSEFDVVARAEITTDAVSSAPGDELLTGEIIALTDVKEEWLGLTWSYKPSAKVSFGLTNFVTVRNKAAQFNIRLQALTKTNTVVIFNNNRNYEMNNLGLLWKGGLAFDFSPLTAGLVFTTPRINISGNGSYLFEEFLNGVDRDGDGVLDDVFSSSFQQDIEADFRSPWAIGIGTGLTLGRAIIHLSAEWYDKVDRYTLLSPEPFFRQTDSVVVDIKVIDDLDDVLNYGVGLELRLKDNVSAYASFATDFTAVKSDASSLSNLETTTNNSATKTDFINFAGGSTFTLKGKVELTLGLGYAFGKQTFARPLDLPDEDGEPISDENSSGELRISRWQFIFGFSFPFLSNIQGEEGE